MDQTIPQELVCEWEQILEETMNCEVVVIKWWNANLAHSHKLEVQGFSGSSLQTYGCYVYITSINLDGTVKTSFTFKSNFTYIQITCFSHAKSKHLKIRTYGHTFVAKIHH